MGIILVALVKKKEMGPNAVIERKEKENKFEVIKLRGLINLG